MKRNEKSEVFFFKLKLYPNFGHLYTDWLLRLLQSLSADESPFLSTRYSHIAENWEASKFQKLNIQKHYKYHISEP